jgi:hypothetical protein
MYSGIRLYLHMYIPMYICMLVDPHCDTPPRLCRYVSLNTTLFSLSIRCCKYWHLNASISGKNTFWGEHLFLQRWSRKYSIFNKATKAFLKTGRCRLFCAVVSFTRLEGEKVIDKKSFFPVLYFRDRCFRTLPVPSCTCWQIGIFPPSFVASSPRDQCYDF